MADNSNVRNSSTIATEQHYTPKELGELWGFAEKTIRKMFQDEPGVIVYGSEGGSSRRRYRSLRIPESIARSVHARLHQR